MDYEPVMQNFSVSRGSSGEVPIVCKTINILNNPSSNEKRKFFLHVLGECGIDAWIEICILNDTGSEFVILLHVILYNAVCCISMYICS